MLKRLLLKRNILKLKVELSLFLKVIILFIIIHYFSFIHSLFIIHYSFAIYSIICLLISLFISCYIIFSYINNINQFNFQETEFPGGGDRVIIISGREQDVQEAQKIIEMKLQDLSVFFTFLISNTKNTINPSSSLAQTSNKNSLKYLYINRMDIISF